MSYFRIPNSADWTSSSGTGGATARIDASTKGEGGVAVADRACVIDRIAVYAGTISTPPVYRIGLQSVSARLPSGTYLGATNSGYGDITPTTGAVQVVTLNESVTLAKGDAFAMTILYQSGTIGASNYADFIAMSGTTDFQPVFPYGVTRTASTWAVATNFCRIMPIATDGSMYPGIMLSIDQDHQNASWSSSNSPTRRGNGITMVGTKRLLRVVFNATLAATSVVAVELWKEGDSAALATQTVTTDTDFHSTSFGWGVAFFNTTLNSGSTYFFVLRPTTTANVTTFRYVRYHNAEAQKAHAGSLFAATAVAGTPPTWTKYNNGTDGFRMYAIWPEFDDETSGGGGGFGSPFIRAASQTQS